MDRDCLDFFEGGQPLQAFLDAVLHQCGHPVFNGGLDHLFRFRFGLNQPFQPVRSQQQFVQRDPALETRPVADFASFAAGQAERIVVRDAEFVPVFRAVALTNLFVFLFRSGVLFFAVFADPTREALGEHTEHGIGETEGIAAHIEQAGDGFHRAVGVQSTHHQVAGEGRFDTDIRRFFIPHFSYHDDVRISAEKGAHGLGKGKVDFRLHLDLAEPVLCDFDRILRRPDLDIGGIDVPEDRMQRRRFPRTGRSDAEDDSVGFLRDIPNGFEVPLGKSHLVERQGFAGCEDTHDHVFVITGCGDCGHAQLDFS